MSSQRQTFVILGAGPAGAKAAATLREEGFDKSDGFSRRFRHRVPGVNG